MVERVSGGLATIAGGPPSISPLQQRLAAATAEQLPP